jgi:hypothetical protein
VKLSLIWSLRFLSKALWCARFSACDIKHCSWGTGRDLNWCCISTFLTYKWPGKYRLTNQMH